MKRLVVLLTLATAGAVAAQSAPPASSVRPAPSADRGRLLVERNCSTCHAVGLLDESPMKEAPPFREVVERYDPLVLQEAFAEGVVVGHPAMPEFTLTTDQLGDLVAYLETLQVTPPD